jgi:hypothetical protein
MEPTVQIILASAAFGAVVGKLIEGTVNLFANHHDRGGKRKELLLSIAKDFALKEYEMQTEKMGLAPPIAVLTVGHYNSLKHLIDTDGDIHPATLKGYQESMKDPAVIAKMRQIQAHGGTV